MLTTLLVVMTALYGYAQDSYREAVKEYLSATGVFEEAESFMPILNMVFENDGQVDIEQLTKRYMDELFEDFMIDNSMAKMKAHGLTEIDLKLVTSMLATPQGKVFHAHQKKWFLDLSSFMFTPLMKMMDRYSKPEEERGHYEHVEIWPGFLDGATVQPKAEIDDAYAAKFNEVIMESDFVKVFLDVIKKRMNETSKAFSLSGITTPESQKENNDRIMNALPTIMLNSAYGILTPEDIDYASILFSNEAYTKLQINLNTEDDGMGKIGLNYIEWMQEQGAKITKNPAALMNIFRLLSNKGD